MNGIGVMLSFLGGNQETVEAINKSLNKKITNCNIDDAEIVLSFEDNSKLIFFDDGQSCCESRYMRTDDKVGSIVGHNFTGAEIKDAPNIEDGGEVHEVQFLEIKTDGGSIVVSNHNEHNGYYGGFSISAKIRTES